MDTLVVKQNDVFALDMYTKPTATGQYLNFLSLVPTGYKIGLIKCLIGRILCICSNWDFIHSQIERVKTDLLSNGYPLKLIEKCTNDVISKFQIKDIVCNVPKQRVLLKLPFCGVTSVKLKSRLIKLFSDFYPSAELRVIFKKGLTIGQLFSVKDRVPNNVRSHAIYKLNCEGCDSFYIGKTTMHVSFRTNREISSAAENSCAFRHNAEFGPPHTFSNTNVELLAFDRYDSRLVIKESLAIQFHKPKLNLDQQSTKLLLI